MCIECLFIKLLQRNWSHLSSKRKLVEVRQIPLTLQTGGKRTRADYMYFSYSAVQYHSVAKWNVRNRHRRQTDSSRDLLHIKRMTWPNLSATKATWCKGSLSFYVSIMANGVVMMSNVSRSSKNESAIIPWGDCINQLWFLLRHHRMHVSRYNNRRINFIRQILLLDRRNRHFWLCWRLRVARSTTSSLHEGWKMVQLDSRLQEPGRSWSSQRLEESKSKIIVPQMFVERCFSLQLTVYCNELINVYNADESCCVN